MSYYESPEQRQIRELRRRLDTAINNNNESARVRRDLQRQINQNEAARVRAENRLQDSINRQQQQIRAQEAMNQRLSESVRELDREIIAQEQRHNQQVQQLREQHAADIMQTNQRITHVAQELNGKIDQTREDLENEITDLRNETNEQLNYIRAQRERDIAWTRQQFENTNSRISSLENVIQNHHELAEYWLSQAQRLAAEIREQHQPERFGSHEWQTLLQNIKDAEDDIKSGMYQTAADKGRDAYREAYRLRDTLIQLEMEWQQTLEAVRKIEETLLSNLADAKGREYTFDLNGEKISDTQGVDYWSYGQLNVLNNRIEDIRIRLNTNTDQLTTEELGNIFSELTGFMTELSLLENAAATNITMAQGRAEMAVRIGQVLGDEFLMVESDGDYFAEENRDEYHAVFRNPTTKEEAVVTITPLVGEDGIVVNHAELMVGVPTNSPEDRSAINDAVVRQVSKEVDGFALPCSEQHGNNTNAEMERTGNISAVAEGKEQTRSACSRGITSHEGVHRLNPVLRAEQGNARSSTHQ